MVFVAGQYKTLPDKNELMILLTKKNKKLEELSCCGWEFLNPSILTG